MSDKQQLAAEVVRTALIVGGTAMLGVGSALLHPAAGFIVPGGIMLALGIIGALRTKG
ncbi:hypothetical protein [Magnetospirillum aberrantis]|uniref:Uncharacterized protein n=1 Tax=Magnetospirillum aberrantis SpK TaxID=908842 RepID=A0A7C9UTF3_9PROT|nr:hypothetical protein [Magnetospirillum aberrantis]NFV80008.1 hypothetical protein [Magnetospirillum aberrantis SpK]